MADFFIISSPSPGEWRIVTIDPQNLSAEEWVAVTNKLSWTPAPWDLSSEIYKQFLIFGSAYRSINPPIPGWRDAYNIAVIDTPQRMQLIPTNDTLFSPTFPELYTFERADDATLAYSVKVSSINTLTNLYTIVTVPIIYLHVSTFYPSRGINQAKSGAGVPATASPLFAQAGRGTLLKPFPYGFWGSAPFVEVKHKLFGNTKHALIARTRTETSSLESRAKANTDNTPFGVVWLGQATDTTTLQFVGQDKNNALIGVDPWDINNPPEIPEPCEDPDAPDCTFEEDIQALIDELQASIIHVVNESDGLPFILRSTTCKIEGFNVRKKRIGPNQYEWQNIDVPDQISVPLPDGGEYVLSIDDVVRVNDADVWIDWVPNYPMPDANGHVGYVYYVWREKDATRIPPRLQPPTPDEENNARYITWQVHGLKLDTNAASPTFNLPVVITEKINQNPILIERPQGQTDEIGLVWNIFVQNGYLFIWYSKAIQFNLNFDFARGCIAVYDVSSYEKKQNPTLVVRHEYTQDPDNLSLPSYIGKPVYAPENEIILVPSNNQAAGGNTGFIYQIKEPIATNIVKNPLKKGVANGIHTIGHITVSDGEFDFPDPQNEHGPPQCRLDNPTNLECVPLNTVIDVTVEDTSDLEPATPPSGISTIVAEIKIGSGNPEVVFNLNDTVPNGQYHDPWDDNSVPAQAIPIPNSSGFNYRLQIAKDTPYPEGRHVILEITAEDKNGTPGVCLHEWITYESVAPVCDNKEPLPNAIDVPVDAHIKLDIIDPPDDQQPDFIQSGVKKSTIIITVQIGANQEDTIYTGATDTYSNEYRGSLDIQLPLLNGYQFNLVHATLWPFSTVIQVNATFEDECGNPGSCSWTFTTEAEDVECEKDAPVCQNQIPPPGTINVPVVSPFSFDIVDPQTNPLIPQSGVVIESITIDVQIGANPAERVFEVIDGTPKFIDEYGFSWYTVLPVHKGFRFTLVHGTPWPYNTAITVTSAFRDFCLNMGGCSWTFMTEKEELPGEIDNCAHLLNAAGKEEHIHLNPNEGKLPDENRFAWTKVGSIPVSLEDDNRYFLISDDSANQQCLYKRVPPMKPGSDLQIAFEIEVTSFGTVPTATFAEISTTGGASAIQIQVQDGFRYFAIAIGDKVDLTDSSGSPLKGSPGTPIGIGLRHQIRLRKHQNRYFELFVNGELMANIPYVRAEYIGLYSDVFIQWGTLQNLQAVFKLFFFEYAINSPIATESYLDRFLRAFPKFIVINQLLTAQSRGLLREAQREKEEILSLKEARKSDAVLIERHELDGLVLPDQDIDPWTAGESASAIIDLEEIKISSTSSLTYLAKGGGTSMEQKNRFYSKTLESNKWFDYYFDVILEIEDGFMPDTRGFMGPYIRLDDGIKEVYLFWVQDRRTKEVKVGFADGKITTDPNFLSRTWIVDPTLKNRYQIFKSADRETWLFVNGRIVDSIKYADMVDSPEQAGQSNQGILLAADALIEWGTLQVNAESITRWKAIKVEVTINGNHAPECTKPWVPFRQKGELLRHAQDRLLFPSYQETNSELFWLIATADGTHQNRGTNLALIELSRITQGKCFIVQETLPAEWTLNVSDVLGRIWLNTTGNLSRAYIEFENKNSAYTAADIKELINRFLFPFDTYGSQFIPAIIMKIISINTADPTDDTIEVESTKDISPKDEVLVKKADHSFSETAIVKTVINSTHFSVEKLTGAYVAGDFVRKVL